VKSSKAQIYTKFHKIPEINFEERQLTSFAGILIFQLLFKRLDLKNKLKKCFSYTKLSPIFGHYTIALLLIVHLILGFRRLREIDYYREDSMVLRLMGLNALSLTIDHVFQILRKKFRQPCNTECGINVS